MRIKKFLALLLSAALALTLLAGCGSQSLLQLLVDLLQQQYQNITVTAEDDLEVILRRVVRENDTLDDMDNALQEDLQSTIEFERLRSARAGDKAFDLVYKPGTDAQAIARQTYTEWNKVLGSLPSRGQYLADLAVLPSGGGYYILVDITVKKGGSSGSSDDGSAGDENDGETTVPQKDYEWQGENLILVHTNEGLQKVFFKNMEQEDSKLMTAREGGFYGITIQLENNETYTVNQTFETQFEGVLTSAKKEDRATIQLSNHSMFSLIGDDGNIFDPECIISYIDFVVTGVITSGTESEIWNEYEIGAVTNQNSGTISYCNVTFKEGAGIEATSNKLKICVGGIAGYNLFGTIEYCTVKGGMIKTDVQSSLLGLVFVGGITGCNDYDGAVESCSVSDGKIDVNIPNDISLFYDQNNLLGSAVAVGGVVGFNTNWSSVENYDVYNTSVNLQYAPDSSESVDTSDYIAVNEKIGLNQNP